MEFNFGIDINAIKCEDGDMQNKRRRLVNEIVGITHQLNLVKEQIKYDPYPEDQPILKRQLAELKTDLAAAKRELANAK